MTFEEFQNTKVKEKNIGMVLDDESLEGVTGLVYCGNFFIEHHKDDFLLTIGNSRWLASEWVNGLEDLERILYDFADDEGYIKH